jgi:uncharacterized membrane protein YphA (DoxX/SURF4 family)
LPGSWAEGSKARVRLAWILGLLPAGVLLYAGLLKALDPALFAEQITAHKVTPAGWSPWIAQVTIAAELLLGFALVLFLKPRIAHVLFLLLMAGFIAVTAIAWSHGNTKECGCFGRAVGRGPLLVIVQDAVLMIVSGVCLVLARGARTPSFARRTAFVALPAALAFGLLGAKLPADGFVTGVRPGSDLSDVPIEDLNPPHTEGTVLLVLVDGACTPCDEALPRLNELAREERGRLRVTAVFAGSRQEAMAWRLKRLPAFPVSNASARALRAYYRALPASFLVRDGRLVRAFWDGIPAREQILPLLRESS